METAEYYIRYQDFNGPTSLLLELVRKRKIDIYQVTLNSIIYDFLYFVEENKKTIQLETLSSFLYVASILLEIKSRSVIPSQQKMFSEDDEPGQLDKGLLAERERQLRIFQKISNYLQGLMEEEKLYFVRESPVEEEFIDIMPDIFQNLNTGYLNFLASKLLSRNDFEIDLSTVYLDGSTITIIEEMDRIKNLLLEKKEVAFRDLSCKYELLIDKIICFLSILELYKNEYIDIIQFENFGDIKIRSLANKAGS